MGINGFRREGKGGSVAGRRYRISELWIVFREFLTVM